ncbi:two-partner secretion domain-containing protein [Caballeronia terrestris]|uniref:two-partner secretion domain-containing protein n=1 Tax=Caballeronia terrestris TaxID=1226301 RepID=UPI0035B55607
MDNPGGATLNRVTGLSISKIDGKLTSVASVYLINPQGIVIGRDGRTLRRVDARHWQRRLHAQLARRVLWRRAEGRRHQSRQDQFERRRRAAHRREEGGERGRDPRG